MTLRTAFVTGATGLLGNNLVRALIKDGWSVRALARDPRKAEAQFGGASGIEIVIGDLSDVSTFAPTLDGANVLFHAAAHFRDSYKGGDHWPELERINVDGTANLMAAAYAAGVRKMIHTSSIAVLDGAPGQSITERDDRAEKDADDYYRSKILAERVVRAFLDEHPDFDACFVLPGWMWGPGDLGPTSSGQVALDTVRGKLPGLAPGSFSVVDARDVAAAHIAAVRSGRRGERYLAAGRHMTMVDLIPMIGRIANVPTPTLKLPAALLFVLAAMQETYARATGKPVLLSMATVKGMIAHEGRSHFDPTKSRGELGLTFRPVEATIADTLNWYRERGWLPATGPEIERLKAAA